MQTATNMEQSGFLEATLLRQAEGELKNRIPFLVWVLLLQLKILQELQKDLIKENWVNWETLFKQRGVENYLIDNFWELEQVRIHQGIPQGIHRGIPRGK